MELLLEAGQRSVHHQEKCMDNFWFMKPDSANKTKRDLGDKRESFLLRSRDLKWGTRKKVKYVSRLDDSPSLLPSMEEVRKEEESRKRLREEKEQEANEKEVEHGFNLRLHLEKFNEAKRKRDGTGTKCIMLKKKERKKLKRKCRTEKEGSSRWSTARLDYAKRTIVEVMRKMGATRRKPVLRHNLREEVRKRIGDLGLLDYCLKDMSGIVVGDTKEWFVRQRKTKVATEFWLEPADKAPVSHEAGITDSYSAPLLDCEPRNEGSKFSCGGHCETMVSQLKAEINLLRSEIGKLMKSLKETETVTLEQSQVQLQLQKSWQEKHESLLMQHQNLQNELTSISKSFLEMKEMLVMFVKEPGQTNQASEMQFAKENEKGKQPLAGNEVSTKKKMVPQKGFKNYQHQGTFLQPNLSTSSLPSPCSGFFYQTLLQSQCQNQTQAQSVAIHAQSQSLWLAPHPSARSPPPGMRNFQASQMVCDELILVNAPNQDELGGGT